MSSPDWNKLDPPRQKLLRIKLGDLLYWTPPVIAKTVGPYDPGAFDSFKQRVLELVDAHVKRLLEIPDDEIELLISDKDRVPSLAREWSSFQSNQIDSLRHNIPVWYAGGLGVPDHAADLVYWAKMPNFTVHEMTCLSAGVDPAAFKSLEPSKPSKPWDPPEAAALTFLIKRHTLIKRQFNPYDQNDSIKPRSFLDWSDNVDFEVLPEFATLLRQYHTAAPKPSRAIPTAPEPNKREIDTIAQLFTAMAIDQLGYVPTDAKSPIPKEIAGIADQLGLSGTDDTVRKYLRLGATFLPEGWKPE